MVVDIREGSGLNQLADGISPMRKRLDVTLLYLETSDNVLVRRFSETRRPHPLGAANLGAFARWKTSAAAWTPIRNIADLDLDTSKFNVHELRAT